MSEHQPIALKDADLLYKQLSTLSNAEIVVSLSGMNEAQKKSLVTPSRGGYCKLLKLLVDNCFFNRPESADIGLENERLLIAALTMLETEDFNIYDTNVGFKQYGLLNLTVTNLLSIPSRGNFGNLSVAHIAERVSNIDQLTDPYELPMLSNYRRKTGELSRLMFAVIVGDINITRVLIDCGANPDLQNEMGYDCHHFAKATMKLNPDFYREFLAMMLNRDHQQLTSRTTQRVSL